MPDKYPSMTALYKDPHNIEGTTYAKRWHDHNKEGTHAVVLALHGGGIEPGTSEIALATAGFDPATLAPAADGFGTHDFWLFEGLLPQGNAELHVKASHYDEPIATKLVENARRCISLHGCTDEHTNGKIQLGGLDDVLRDIVLEELQGAGIEAEIATNPLLAGTSPHNIANKTTVGGCAQLEIGRSYRDSLFAINTTAQRKNTTTSEFRKLVAALRRAMSRS